MGGQVSGDCPASSGDQLARLEYTHTNLHLLHAIMSTNRKYLNLVKDILIFISTPHDSEHS